MCILLWYWIRVGIKAAVSRDSDWQSAIWMDAYLYRYTHYRYLLYIFRFWAYSSALKELIIKFMKCPCSLPLKSKKYLHMKPKCYCSDVIAYKPTMVGHGRYSLKIRQCVSKNPPKHYSKAPGPVNSCASRRPAGAAWHWSSAAPGPSSPAGASGDQAQTWPSKGSSLKWYFH